MTHVLIIGATSAIAQETARQFARQGARLSLVGRNLEKLAAVADDLRVRGSPEVKTFQADLTDLHRHKELIAAAIAALGELDSALIAHGMLPDHKLCEKSVDESVAAFETNTLSVISLATHLANYFAARRSGLIAVVTSVAADRGRQRNYLYGATKGAVDIFLQGLRQRLHKADVSVTTVKPGFVDTPMTAALPKNALYASPQAVGKAIYRAMIKRKDVVYVPWFWRWIMAVIRMIPESVFKRLSL
jgi:hypothetical protein